MKNDKTNIVDNKNNMCCIVIPVYKKEPSVTEITSLKQCLKLLSQFHIIFITYNKLNTLFYTNICKEYNASFSYEYFPSFYFSDIFGYNALMLSKHFYTVFSRYKYMLVYQLDAYVFRNELEYWCMQDYDYIGAPWLTSREIPEPPTFGLYNNLLVGNGGFSLRKIETFIRLCSSKIWRMYFFSLCIAFFNILAKKSSCHPGYQAVRILLFPIKILNDKLYMMLNSSRYEDVVWSKIMLSCGKIPSCSLSMRFSFEDYADYLYELTNHELPFGCHAWTKYYNWHHFWKKFIVME